MSRVPSLQSRLTWWFAAALLALYGTAAVLGWHYARKAERQYALLALKQEVEQVAAYIAASGRLDAPEFDHAEDDPIPLWVRAVRGDRILRSSPGAPDLPLLPPDAEHTLLTHTFRRGGTRYMIVRHIVGRSHGALAVEALGSLRPLQAREWKLGGALVLTGLLLIPVAAFGGGRLAARALRPLDRLVASIRRIDPAAHGARLEAPGDVVQEVEVLTAAFNDLLARLQETMDAMRRFTADASHEIRNPLSVLRSGLEIALRRERSPEQYRTVMRENLDEIDRLNSVLEGLLAMTRGGPEGSYPLRRDLVDLAPLVQRTLASFERVAAARAIALSADVVPGAIVRGDAALLRLVLFNLVDNAIKHGRDGQPVEVRLERAGQDVQLSVADRGAGVPAEVRARLFERYNRPAGSGGAGGLGLSVVRWVVELHGGAIRLAEAPVGARFELTLPAADAAEVPCAR